MNRFSNKSIKTASFKGAKLKPTAYAHDIASINGR